MVAPRRRDNNTSAPVGAPPAPLREGCEWIETNPGRRHASRERRTLRCLTSLVETSASGSFARGRPLVSRASVARHRSRACPRSAVRRRKSGKPDLRRPRGDTTDRNRQPYCASRLLRWVSALVPFGFASLHSAGTRERGCTRTPRSQIRGAFWPNEPKLQKRNNCAPPCGESNDLVHSFDIVRPR